MLHDENKSIFLLLGAGFYVPLRTAKTNYGGFHRMIIETSIEEVGELQSAMSAKDVEIAQLKIENARLSKENETLIAIAARTVNNTVEDLKKVLGGVCVFSNPVKVEVAGNLMTQQLNEIHDNNLSIGEDGN